MEIASITKTFFLLEIHFYGCARRKKSAEKASTGNHSEAGGELLNLLIDTTKPRSSTEKFDRGFS